MSFRFISLLGAFASTFSLASMAQEEVRCCGIAELTSEHMKCPELARMKNKPDLGVRYAFLGTCETDAQREERQARARSDRLTQESLPAKKTGPDENQISKKNIKALGKINKRVEGKLPLPDKDNKMAMITFQPTEHQDAIIPPYELMFIFEMADQKISIWEKRNQLEQKKLIGKNVPGYEGTWKKNGEIPQSAFSEAKDISYVVISSGSITFNLGKTKIDYLQGKVSITTTK